MNGKDITTIAAAIVTVAMVTVIVSSNNSAGIVGAIGDVFTDSIRAATGIGEPKKRTTPKGAV